MFKNVASQQIVLLAIDTATNTPKTGDAANITAYLSKDYGTVTVLGDTTATEMDATNAPGLYKFDVTQTESNCDVAVFSGKSITSGVRIVPVTVFMRPANMTAMSIDSSGRLDMAKLAGQTITAGAGVTFPSSIASPTNITAATGVTLAAVTHTGAVIPTVTTVTNQLTAAAISTQVQTDLGTGAALTSLASQSSVNTLAGYVDTEVAAILDAVSSSGVVLSAAQMNKIADHVLRRNMANVEASSSGDTLSLSSQYGAIQQAQESSLSGVTMTVKKTDGSTTLGTKTVVTSSSANPITGIS